MAVESGSEYQGGWRHFAARLMAAAVLLGLTSVCAFAQTLSAPSRSVYKCSINGSTSYSDAPCMEAERIEIEPTRGVGKTPGRDVQHERHREMVAEAIRPLTGMDARQLDVQGRRMKLPVEAQRECRFLDVRIPDAERDERRATPEQRDMVKVSLFNLRHRQRSLRC